MSTKTVWPLLVMLSASTVGCGLNEATSSSAVAISANVMTARGLNIVDDEGRVRISLGMSSGFPSVSLFDEDGTCRVRLSGGISQLESTDESAGLLMATRDPGTVVWLGLEHRYPVLKMYHEGGDLLVGIGVNPGSVPFLVLRNKTGDIYEASPTAAAFSPTQSPVRPGDSVRH